MPIKKDDSLLRTLVKRCLWMVLWLCGAFLVICPDSLWAASITGNVFEDINYGGGAGRNWATASGNGGQTRPNARVELFNDNGRICDISHHECRRKLLLSRSNCRK